MTSHPTPQSPLPWRTDGEVIGWNSGRLPAVRVTFTPEPGRWAPVCMVWTEGSSTPASGIANAAYIVWAANNIDPLLEALRRLLGEADAYLDYANDDAMQKAVDIARRALSHASGDTTND